MDTREEARAGPTSPGEPSEAEWEAYALEWLGEWGWRHVDDVLAHFLRRDSQDAFHENHRIHELLTRGVTTT